MNPKVSVIVPVYNSEKYLKKCIDSLLAQTLKEIEIILVNDGSTDGSRTICEEYQKSYGNISLINRKNAGPSAARNVGIELAHGEYIGFADSDDYVSDRMYEAMYNRAKENDCDLVMCNYHAVKDGKDLHSGKEFFPPDTVMAQEFVNEFVARTADHEYLWFSVRMLFSSELLGTLRFAVGNIVEDPPFNLEALLKSKRSLYIPEAFYFYEQTEGSLMRKKDTSGLFERLNNLYHAKKDIFSRYGIKNYEIALSEYTVRHTLPMLLSSEVHKERPLRDKIKTFKEWRGSEMIKEAFERSTPKCIESKLRYLAVLLKYRLYLTLSLATYL